MTKETGLFIYNVIGRQTAAGGGEAAYESRQLACVQGTPVGKRYAFAPEIDGGSSNVGKKAGRSEVVTGVLRSVGVPEPGVGPDIGFSAQSNPSAPTSARESRCGPDG